MMKYKIIERNILGYTEIGYSKSGFSEFKFRPTVISETIFVDLKQSINIETRFPFKTNKIFFKQFRLDITYFAICVLLLLIDSNNYPHWVKGIKVLTLSFSTIMIPFFISNLFSFLSYDHEKVTYWESIKLNILNSNSYKSFISFHKFELIN
jgi:hypothetical protein